MREYFDMLFELTATAMETCGCSIPTDLRFAPAGQPFAKSHAAQLRPLISDENLDRVESKLRDALVMVPEPYRTRIENQRRLFSFVRLEARNIYTQVSLAAEFTDAMKSTSSNADRQRAIARFEAAMKGFVKTTEDASAIILSAPADLTGRIIFEDSGPRNGTNWKMWDLQPMLDQLKAKVRLGKG